MPKRDDIGNWDRIAPRYMEAVLDGSLSFYERSADFIWEHLGDVAGRMILDLGCGSGWLSGELHQAGAQVTGMDGSKALLMRAASDHPHVEFLRHDLVDGLPRPLGSFDRIIAHMVLMDLPSLDLLVADVSSSLVGDGVFIFTILHPCFFGTKVIEDPDSASCYRRLDSYRELQVRWIDTFGGHNHYHRPLSWYFALLRKNGLAVIDLIEPPTPSRPGSDQMPIGIERLRRSVPTMVAAACRRC